ncbi:hypothetical protein E0K83_16890 [Gramella sp. BOM4]|nr:hypothetical protein [Christiangramia bathymodioli]
MNRFLKTALKIFGLSCILFLITFSLFFIEAQLDQPARSGEGSVLNLLPYLFTSLIWIFLLLTSLYHFLFDSKTAVIRMIWAISLTSLTGMVVYNFGFWLDDGFSSINMSLPYLIVLVIGGFSLFLLHNLIFRKQGF